MSASSETDVDLPTGQLPVKPVLPKTASSSELLRKRQSLTQADLIDLPSPPKNKKISPPKATVV